MDRTLVTTSTMMEINGEEIEVNVDGYVQYSVDTQYGADADGKRGIKRTVVDDVENIGVYDPLSFDDIYDSLNDNNKEKASDAIVEAFLERQEY